VFLAEAKVNPLPDQNLIVPQEKAQRCNGSSSRRIADSDFISI
jgi:hypothetical protein